MLKEVSYKNKNRFLMAGVLLLLVILYPLSFKPSFLLYKKCSYMRQQVSLAKDAPIRVAILRNQEKEFDHVLGITKGEDNSQERILSTIADYCQENKILLKEFPKTISKQEKEYLIETNYFTIEGGFVKLLKLCYELEQKNKVGKIASVNYELKKDYKTQEDFLTAMIYIQNIKKLTQETLTR